MICPRTHPPSTPDAAGRALGLELIRVHDELREFLARLLDPDSSGDGAAVVGRPLLAHCLAFCAAVTAHHSAEDAGAFPALAARFPELAPVLAELAFDHSLIADILRRVESLAADPDGSGGTPATGPARAELAGLSAVLESHFRWEERRLVEALTALPAVDPVPDLLAAAAVRNAVRGAEPPG